MAASASDRVSRAFEDSGVDESRVVLVGVLFLPLEFSETLPRDTDNVAGSIGLSRLGLCAETERLRLGGPVDRDRRLSRPEGSLPAPSGRDLPLLQDRRRSFEGVISEDVSVPETTDSDADIAETEPWFSSA